jgi:uncharacterized hydrophobic protein (TIGR00341 family)
MRYIDISLPTRLCDSVLSALSDFNDPSRIVSHAEGGRSEIRFVLSDGDTQTIVDRLQSILSEEQNWRVTVLPVEAACSPFIEAIDAKDRNKPGKSTITREEINQKIKSGMKLNSDFIALSILSAVVAALGLNSDNVAVVIGAMVIAPFLGPILAFSFGAALGQTQIMLNATRTAIVGVGLGVLTTYLMTFLIEVNTKSGELLDRAEVTLDTIALALASGAAAALSLVTGLSSTLVGVMVAVALLPPSAAFALFIGSGEPQLALKALLLLLTNITCIALSSQIVFAAKNIRPRLWSDQKTAGVSRRINMLVWGGLLIALGVLIYFQTPSLPAA